jgi:hypothetical protein
VIQVGSDAEVMAGVSAIGEGQPNKTIRPMQCPGVTLRREFSCGGLGTAVSSESGSSDQGQASVGQELTVAREEDLVPSIKISGTGKALA